MPKVLILLGYIVGAVVLDVLICWWGDIRTSGRFEAVVVHRMFLVWVGVGLYYILSVTE